MKNEKKRKKNKDNNTFILWGKIVSDFININVSDQYSMIHHQDERAKNVKENS